jgi:hypothetical protein
MSAGMIMCEKYWVGIFVVDIGGSLRLVRAIIVEGPDCQIDGSYSTVYNRISFF